MPVRARPSASIAPWRVTDGTRPSEGRRPGSTPGKGTRLFPCGCGGRTAVFEAARPGSIPGWGTRQRSCSDRCPRSVTDAHTTLRRSETRFDSWRGHALRGRVEALRAPEPDGRAAVCKTAEAGSTPAGASHRLSPTFPLSIHHDQLVFYPGPSVVKSADSPFLTPREGLTLVQRTCAAVSLRKALGRAVNV